MRPDLEALLHALSASGVRFVVIGGVAVGVHGYVRATKDLDVCPAGDRENLERFARLLTLSCCPRSTLSRYSPQNDM